MSAASPDPVLDDRKRALLDAAAGVFLRFGFKKTSMDDVARAGGLSRQGLYLHFASKDELFAAALLHLQDTALTAARARLHDDTLPLVDRLVDSFSVMHGLHFTHNTTVEHMAELKLAVPPALAAVVATRQGRFAVDVIKVLRAEGLPSSSAKPSASSKLSAKDLVLTLEAAAMGLKHSAPSLAAYQQHMRVVARVVCGEKS